MFEYIIDCIAPHVCLGCHQEGSLLCQECQGTLPAATERHQRFRLAASADQLQLDVFAATEYHTLAKDLIHALKFGRARAGAAAAAQLMAGRLPAIADEVVLSFVPTVARRTRVRGYDQAALIARRLAGLRQVPCLPLLDRSGRQRQVGQSRAIRKQQLQSAFQVRAAQQVQEKHIVLVDDVITTGATLEAAAIALYGAGARRVDAVVFAAA